MRRIMIAVALVSALALLACGGDDDEKGGSVSVTLREFSISTDKSSAPAGAITFNVTNTGPDDAHEFEVIKTDLALNAIPKNDDGSANTEDLEEVDELEELEVGSSESLAVDLERGKYVLICNLLEQEDGEIVAHFQQGMRKEFTVE